MGAKKNNLINMGELLQSEIRMLAIS